MAIETAIWRIDADWIEATGSPCSAMSGPRRPSTSTKSSGFVHDAAIPAEFGRRYARCGVAVRQQPPM